MGEKSHVNLLIKFVLFFFNFAIFLVSGAVTGLMAWILVEKEKTVKNAWDFFLDPSCVICLVGSIAFTIAFFGWFGSLRENLLCLKIYRYTMMFTFLVEVTFIILIFVIVYVPDARDQLNIYPEDSLKKAVVLYRDDEDMQDLIDGIQELDSLKKAVDFYRDDEDMQDLMDDIQELLECCGTSADDEGYKDWSQNAYFNCSTGTNERDFGEYCSVPFSCCIKTDTGLVNYMCGKDMQSKDTDSLVRSNTIHTRGCFKAITTVLENNVLVVGGVTIGILIPQMVLTAMTANLIQQIKIQMSKWNRMPRPT